MSEPIKIKGEWRSMETLTPGIWLGRLGGFSDVMCVMSIRNECKAYSDREYLGPLEIIEPEPEPTPLPGCRCELRSLHGGAVYCSSLNSNDWSTMAVLGVDRRQAILRHNAAVAAIVEMEGHQ